MVQLQDCLDMCKMIVIDYSFLDPLKHNQINLVI